MTTQVSAGPTRLLVTFLRHAQSVGNAQAIRQGQGDLPLTAEGRDRARTLARRWVAEGRTFDAVLTSPLRRAAETAVIFAQALGLPAPEIMPALMERHIGEYTLRPAAEVRAQEPPWRSLYEPVGQTGESVWDLYLRAGQVVANLVRRPPGHYLVVGHGMLLNMVFYTLLGIAPQPFPAGPLFPLPNLGHAKFVYEQDASHERWMLLSFGGPEGRCSDFGSG